MLIINTSVKRMSFAIIFSLVIIFYLFPIIGTRLHYILLPLIFYAVYSENPDYFPGLSLFLITGNFYMFTLLFCVVLTVFLKWKKFYKSELKRLFLITIALTPFFMYLAYQTFFTLNLGIIAGVNPLQYYLAFFPFFYGSRIQKTIKINHIYGIIFILSILTIIQLSGSYESTVRIFFFSLPFFVSLIILFNHRYFRAQNWKILTLFVLFIFLLFLFNLSDFSGLMLMMVIFSSIILFLKYRVKSNRAVKYLTSAWAFIISFVVMIFTVISMDIYSSPLVVQDPEEKFISLRNVYDYGLIKTIADRGPVWKAVWFDVIEEKNILPLAQYHDLHFKSSITQRYIYLSMDAHNVYLELMRRYGILLGPVMSLIYILMLLKSAKLLISTKQKPLIIVLGVNVMSVGILGGLFGHFVLAPTFSFFFMGLAGICYGISVNDKIII